LNKIAMPRKQSSKKEHENRALFVKMQQLQQLNCFFSDAQVRRSNRYFPRKRKKKKAQGKAKLVALFDLSSPLPTHQAARKLFSRDDSQIVAPEGVAPDVRNPQSKAWCEPSSSHHTPHAPRMSRASSTMGRMAASECASPHPSARSASRGKGMKVRVAKESMVLKLEDPTREQFTSDCQALSKKRLVEATPIEAESTPPPVKEWWDMCPYNDSWRVLTYKKNKKDGMVTVVMNNRKTGEVKKVIEGMRACKAATKIAFDACAYIENFYLRPWKVSAAAARVAMGAGGVLPWLLNFKLQVLDGLESMITNAMFARVQRALNKELGKGTDHDRAPLVALDVHKKALVLEEPLNFEGGKDVVEEEDLSLYTQIVLLFVTLYHVLQGFGWEMFHLQIDGHVHPTGKDMKCLVVSYFRAKRVAEGIQAGGVPLKYLHIYGYGGTRPQEHESMNRRVEIALVENQTAVQLSNTATAKLLKTISPSEEYKVFKKAR
jgi:hypothetical protein